MRARVVSIEGRPLIILDDITDVERELLRDPLNIHTELVVASLTREVYVDGNITELHVQIEEGAL